MACVALDYYYTSFLAVKLELRIYVFYFLFCLIFSKFCIFQRKQKNKKMVHVRVRMK